MEIVFSDVLMGFVDLVPVGLFLAAAIILQRLFYNKMSKGAFAVFATGTIVVFVAGLLKALHKILLTLRICNFTPLSAQFFPMQTVGFLLAGIGMVAALFHEQGDGVAKSSPIVGGAAILILGMSGDYSGVPEEKGVMFFVVLMCLGVLLFDGLLVRIAIREKKWLIVALLVLAFIGTLGMGYLSSKEAMNDWVKEFVNSLGQGSLLASAILMKKAGWGKEEFVIALKR